MNFILNNKIFIYLYLVVVFVLFILLNGNTHLFDWDEINFAESAREMIISNNYLDVQINFELFYQKPPLFMWIQVLSMKIFGVNEFAARFPNAVIGIFTLWSLFKIGTKIVNQKFGTIFMIVYSCSFLPFFYFKSGLIDPLFNLLIVLSLYRFYLYSDNLKSNNIILSSLYLGLANLTKGPVSILIFGITIIIYLIWTKKLSLLKNINHIIYFIITLIIFGGLWFVLQILFGNQNILIDFWNYMIVLFREEDAGHGGFFAYHFVVLFFGVFPASIFALKYLGLRLFKNIPDNKFDYIMFVVFWFVLILFSIVNTKIIHYSSLTYFPIAYFAAVVINEYLTKKESKLDFYIKLLLTTVSIVWFTTLILLPFFGNNIKLFLPYIQDINALENLEAIVYWSYWISIVSVILLSFIIFFIWICKDKKISILGLLFSSGFTILLISIIIIPKIEFYTQNSAILFYKSMKNKDVYIEKYGFKSYANYFYAELSDKAKNKKDLSFLLNPKLVDKPVYIVCKANTKNEFIEKYPHFKFIKKSNGFYLFVYEIIK